MSEPIVFVDDVGGALASLASAVAEHRGVVSLATTTVEVAPLAPEIARVLAEVAFPAPRPASRFDGAAHRGRVVHLGREPRAGGSEHWPVQLYEGPARTEFGDTELERLAWARTSRDRIERRLTLP